MDEEHTAVVLVDHGSIRDVANEHLVAVAERYSAATGLIAEAAHMELAAPSIADAFRRCVERGATSIVVCPFFLAPGSHVTLDIPRLVAEAAAEFRALRYRITPPIGESPEIIDAIEGIIGSEPIWSACGPAGWAQE